MVVVVVALAMAMSMAAATHRWPFGAAAGQDRPLHVVAALPYWNLPRDVGRVLAHRTDFAEVSPWMYGLDASGAVVEMAQHGDAARVEQAVSRLVAAGIDVVPTIANVRDGSWDYDTIAGILHDPAARARHVAALVSFAVDHRFGGLDIDYENFRSGDRTVFTRFVTELAGALHAAGKSLSVDLFAKTTDSGYDERNVAQDYRSLGAAADVVRLMAYDWHWSSSQPGPIAPINWVRDVVDYALTRIPAAKISLGVPAYGYDWVGRKGTLVSWLQAYGLEQKYGSPVHWDTYAQSPWLTYRSADGAQHVVWFENAYSTLMKLALARYKKLGGAYLWLAGDEDDLLWQRVSPAAIDAAGKQLSDNGEAVTTP